MSKKVHLTKESLDQIDIMIDELASIRNKESINSSKESIELFSVMKNNVENWIEIIEESYQSNEDRVS